MRILDALRLVRERARHRQEQRKWLASIDGASAALRAAAPSAVSTSTEAQKDYSSHTVVGQVVKEATEAAKNISAWQQNIAKLEQDLAAAQQAALMQRVFLIGGGIVVFVGWLYFRR